MHGLRHDLKTYVVTQNPKTIEHLKQIAILPEKAQPNQVNTLETYGNLLQEIQQIKAKIESKTEQVHNIRHMTEHLNQVRINTRRPIDSNEAMPQYYYRPRMQNTYSRDLDINTRKVGVTGLSLWVNRQRIIHFSRPRV